MTVIAYRDGVMAADTGCWRGDAMMPWARKVIRGPDGTLYGGSGSAARIGAFFAWVESGDGEMPMPVGIESNSSDFAVIAAHADGRIGLLSHEGWEWLQDAPYAAIGACADVCLGAMFAGGDAETAIAAALLHGNGAGGSVMTVHR